MATKKMKIARKMLSKKEKAKGTPPFLSTAWEQRRKARALKQANQGKKKS